MRSKVRLSVFASVLTIVVTALLLWGCIYTFQDKKTFFTLLAVTVIIIFSALLCAPVEINADDEKVTVKSMLKKHRIPMKLIESVEDYKPVLGSNSLATYRFRVLASGGYMGYWGVFYDGDIGRYAAYFGKASDCFLLRLKNGDKYVLGCINPEEMMNYIQKHISEKK